MSTPICHRKMQGALADPQVRPRGMEHEGVYACIGSRCALWVPEVQRPRTVGVVRVGDAQLYDRAMGWERDDDGAPWTPTGRGVCSENYSAQPWTDPNTEMTK